MKKIFLILVLALVFIDCKKETKEINKSYAQLEKANWFIGEWGNSTKESDFTEIWTKSTDSSFVGESFIIVAKDTVFHENVILEQRNDSLFYTVSVKNQTNENPVSFFLTKSSEKELVFENPKHDFPNKITYKQITKDSLVAEISGNQNGKPSKELFPMKKKL
ncbi:DUF6265 family protein [Flavobacterium sp.]|uniref:DUF6265 family protein n=1 Tax=Flavobacterium sp. TaxID=239 RepID=UPI0037507F08